MPTMPSCFAATLLACAWCRAAGAQEPGGDLTILSGNAPGFRVGQYEVSVPLGSSGEQAQNGLVTLWSADSAIMVQIGPLGVAGNERGPALAADYIASAMENWNRQIPLVPVNDVSRLDSVFYLFGISGSGATQRYEQQFVDAQGEPRRFHGIFVLLVGSRGSAAALDVFSAGPAEGDEDWQRVGRYLTNVLLGMRDSGGSEYTDDIQLTLRSLDRFWSREFTRMTPPHPYQKISGFYAYNYEVQPRRDLHCPMQEINALYCPPPIDAILWEEPHLMRLWHHDVGDFAAALVIAHEWGHAVQQRLRLSVDAPPIQREWQADCLAGVWANYVETEEDSLRLEDGDLDEGAQGLFLMRDTTGTPWMDLKAHGTGVARVEAYLVGFRQGFQGCLNPMPRPPRIRK
ncbi:MAG: neutral zinc metallopeptidase [Gemmatimonadales bacterium]